MGDQACYNCGEHGHFSRECPKSSGGGGREGGSKKLTEMFQAHDEPVQVFHLQEKIRQLEGKLAQQFAGKWKLVDSNNFEEYMKAVGIGFITLKEAGDFEPVLSFEVNGEHWKMSSKAAFTTWGIAEFDLGHEAKINTADGRVMKSTFTFNNGKLVEEQKKVKPEDKDSHIERYIDSNGVQLVIECESEGVKAERKYIRECPGR